MNVFVKLDSDGASIDSVCIHPFATSAIMNTVGSGWKILDSNLVNQAESTITVRNQYGQQNSLYQIPYEDFVKYCYQFKRISVTENNEEKIIILFKRNITIDNYNISKLQELDMSVPLSFTRANTIVNFGRL